MVSTHDGHVALTDYREGRPAGWGAYLAGVMHELVALGAAPLEGGARIAVTSEVPVAAGLASSAALTVAAAQALSLLGGTPLQARQLAGVAFRAEHDHVGVRCGIHGSDERGARATGSGTAARVRFARGTPHPDPWPPAARGLGITAGARRGRPQRATGRVRGGRCAAHARIAGASLARELAGGVAATPETSAPRAASLPGPARDRRDGACSVRRAAARPRAPEALRRAAV